MGVHHGHAVGAGRQQRCVNGQLGGQRDGRLARVKVAVEIGERDVVRRREQQAVLVRPPPAHEEVRVVDAQADVTKGRLGEAFQREHPAGKREEAALAQTGNGSGHGSAAPIALGAR